MGFVLYKVVIPDKYGDPLPLYCSSMEHALEVTKSREILEQGWVIFVEMDG